MSIHTELDYNSNISKPISIQFGVLSPQDILKRSVALIDEATLYESGSSEPKLGGLFDPRMGVIERGKKCKTCEQSNVFCPGHFGHIELAKPVFYVQYMRYIFQIIKCICIRCSRLTMDPNNPNILPMKDIIESAKRLGSNKLRFDSIYEKASKIKICPHCGAQQPHKYVKKDLQIVAEWNIVNKVNDINQKDVKKQILTPEMVLLLFKRIPEEDCQIMGFSPKWCMPHWLICSVLPVAPPSVRPSVRQYNNQRSEDDITHKYNDIIKHNNNLIKTLQKENQSEETIKAYTDVLQYHIATLIDNDIQGINSSSHRSSGRPLKTFKQRLHGKEGRIRSNLMGKRVDFSARSVITPDPNIGIQELGVPKKIAMNLSYPEIVNKYNIDKLYKLVRNGYKKYPGAKTIKDGETGVTISLEHKDSSLIRLNYGDIVHRHLLDGDIVLFNRQPSLHKMSMMAHTVVVMDCSSFRLNVTVCGPYNADFDGDEMNMHIPQSIQSAVELRYLAAVPKQLISPSKNSPIIVPSQDGLLGLFKITAEGVYFSQQEVMNLMMKISTFNGDLPKPVFKEGLIERWSGKQLISMILPKINFKYNDDDPRLCVKIVQGNLIKGQISKKSSKKIVHIIFNDYGHKRTQQYLNDLQKIITKYFIRSGFSIGMSDLIVNQKTIDLNSENVLEGKKKVMEMNKEIHLNIFEDVSQNTSELYEIKTMGVLNKIDKNTENTSDKHLDKSNRVNIMVKSGSKGNSVNIRQMLSQLGQQMVDGKRIAEGFDHRTLPHYYKYENSIESRGFITSSYIEGLTPQEFFFHAMTGRQGLIDTAVKTAESGYIQRRIIKATEDLKAAHDFTVRKSNNDIVQFVYGEDGLDSCCLEKQNLELFYITQDKLNKYYKFEEDELWESFMYAKSIRTMKKTKNWNDSLKDYYDEVIDMIHHIHKVFSKRQSGETSVLHCVNFNRLINNVIIQFGINSKNKSDLNPLYVIDQINKIQDDMSVNGIKNNVFKALLLSHLSPKKIIKHKRINKLAFDCIISLIRNRINQSLIQGGDMIGPIAAQSMGEPTTQLTLNTFHYAGVGEKSAVTQGVPRLRELLANTKNMKSPSLNIYLDEEYRYDRNKALNIKYNLQLTRVRDIITSSAIYLDPANQFDTVLEEDKGIMEIYKVFSELDPSCQDTYTNPWVIRFEFDRRTMMDQKINMDDVYQVIYNSMGDISCVYSDDNSGKLIFRIRKDFQSRANTADKDIKILRNLETKIKELIIKGISGINETYMGTKKTNHTIFEDGIYKEVGEFIITTTGTNLIEILSHPHIDGTRTFSNNIQEINAVLGIEAARQMIEREISGVFESSDASVSSRHIGLLCDIMSHNGNIMSVDRHGINKSNIGPLAKCSFEETTVIMMNAAVFGEFDGLKGVSSNIMLGQIPPCGTGDSDIVLDEMKLVETEKIEETKAEHLEDLLDISEYCDTNANFGFNISNIETDNVDLADMPVVEVH